MESTSEAVVVVTPSRNLRDSIIQSPDFLGNVFSEEDLGPRVLWLGRPSDSAGSLCSWEDKIADLVNNRLRVYRQNVQDLAITELRPAFHKIYDAKAHWAAMTPGTPEVMIETLFFDLEI